VKRRARQPRSRESRAHQPTARMITVVTGAAGFVGQALVQRLKESGYPRPVRLVDRRLPHTLPGDFESVEADLTDKAAMAAVINGADRIIHLAALPGGSAEADPAASRRINLDASLDLLEEAGRLPGRVRFVFASTIAVYGMPWGLEVNDATPPRPAMTYGAHKFMVETALLDATRRGVVDGLALRLPGIVARPPGASGLKSAFLSEVFRAIATPRGPFKIPVDPQSTTWLLSASACAEALIHGVSVDLLPGAPRAFLLPALHTTMRALVEAIVKATGNDAGHIRYVPDATMMQLFGRMPPLTTRAAAALGFSHDGSLADLVQAVLSTLRQRQGSA
jgi:D-erythronate 2-dehydrogenase